MKMTREQTHQILFPIQVIRYQIENHTTIIIEVRKRTIIRATFASVLYISITCIRLILDA